MEENLKCLRCHTDVRATDYFCYNCGNNLKPTPPATDIGSQLLLYLGSLLLPPMGLIWGFKYVKQADSRSKIVGIVAIALTVVILIVATQLTINLMNSVNTQVNTQLQNIQGF